MGAPKARCSPELRMCETLLLANPDSKTLRPVRSRASTLAIETRTASRGSTAAVDRGLAARFALSFSGVGPHPICSLISWWVGEVVRHAYKF